MIFHRYQFHEKHLQYIIPPCYLTGKDFCSDLVIDFQNMQISIIRKISPNQKITHNLMGFYDKTNYFKMAETLTLPLMISIQPDIILRRQDSRLMRSQLVWTLSVA